MDVTICRDTVNNKMACGTATPRDVDRPYPGSDFFACAACRGPWIIKQIIECGFDQSAVLAMLTRSPLLGALLQRVGDIAAR